jgi:hypothetical protein
LGSQEEEEEEEEEEEARLKLLKREMAASVMSSPAAESVDVGHTLVGKRVPLYDEETGGLA